MKSFWSLLFCLTMLGLVAGGGCSKGSEQTKEKPPVVQDMNIVQPADNAGTEQKND